MAMDPNDIEFIPANCSISPREMDHQKQNGVKMFKDVLKRSENNKMALKTIANWTVLIEAIYHHTQSRKPSAKIKVLSKIKQTASNALKGNDDKYKIIELMTNNRGFHEFFIGLGFKEGIIENRLVIVEPDTAIIYTAINAIENKIKLMNMYESLSVLWQVGIEALFKDPLCKNESAIMLLSKFMDIDFVQDYQQYYEMLTKLLEITKTQINSRNDLISQTMKRIGLNIPQLVDNKAILRSMGHVYDQFKSIENFKQTILVNEATRNININDVNFKSDEKTDDIFKIQSLTLKEIEY
eukprot:194966_1